MYEDEDEERLFASSVPVPSSSTSSPTTDTSATVDGAKYHDPLLPSLEPAGNSRAQPVIQSVQAKTEDVRKTEIVVNKVLTKSNSNSEASPNQELHVDPAYNKGTVVNPKQASDSGCDNSIAEPGHGLLFIPDQMQNQLQEDVVVPPPADEANSNDSSPIINPLSPSRPNNDRRTN